MIPTGYKDQIPKTHSYPLGAKAISDALAGVPQFDLLKINFFRTWQGFAKNRASTYVLLIVSYDGYGFSLGWTIQVSPVPRPLKHEAQVKLIAEALPQIRKWLQSNPHSNDREGGHRLTFFFDELSGQLTSEEHSSAEWRTERV